MNKIETIDDFKRFLNENHDLLAKRIIDISDLPKDDEWLTDDEWDDVYEERI